MTALLQALVAAEGALVACGVCAIITHALVVRWYRPRYAARRAALSASLAQALCDDAPIVPAHAAVRALSQSTRALREDAVLELATAVTGAAHARLVAIASAAGVLRDADRDGASRSWRRRLRGERLRARLGTTRSPTAPARRLAETALAPAPPATDAARLRNLHAIGAHGQWTEAETLLHHLDDPSYAVRLAAAISLRRLGPTGALLLDRATRGENRAARDIAQHVLELPDVVYRQLVAS